MKILHIVAGAERGGAETFSLDAIKALHEAGVQQYVVCRPHKHVVKALEERIIPYTAISFGRITKFLQQIKIKKSIKSFAPDMVHCWMNRGAIFMPAGMGLPVLGWFGGYYNLKNYKNCHYYMGVTRDIVRHIGEKSGTPERAFVVHTFGTLEADKPVTKADLGVPEDGKTVLLLSRMHWKKGVDTLLEAAKKLEDNVYLLLAGSGPDLEKYQKMAEELGVADRAKFLGWRDDRAALLGVADVCVLPSRYEPFGTVIAEAWYAKVPLVATKADGAKQYVTHESDGLLLEIDDVDTLAAHIDTALKDDAMRAKLIENGQKTYNSLFSKEVVTKELIEAYTKIIDQGIPA
ncbi:MAG TPA: glycosyltransferase family 1 protein [Micavibrio sp.]|nr:glycosyltransferase family 1 protein [Micavibrio sp.]HIL28597.1 glycosyltransferase family 1 protein [Micavibrio sp.]